MRDARRRWIARAAAAALVAVLAGRAGADVGTGAALPDATFHDLAGHAVTTAELHGKPVIIAFWATWCESCKSELEHLRQVRAAHGETELRILAVSVDEERATLDAYLATRSYPFPVYHDPARAAAGRFVADEDLPLTIVADGQGIVRYIARDFAAGAAERLDAAVRQVLAPAP